MKPKNRVPNSLYHSFLLKCHSIELIYLKISIAQLKMFSVLCFTIYKINIYKQYKYFIYMGNKILCHSLMFHFYAGSFHVVPWTGSVHVVYRDIQQRVMLRSCAKATIAIWILYCDAYDFKCHASLFLLWQTPYFYAVKTHPDYTFCFIYLCIW